MSSIPKKRPAQQEPVRPVPNKRVRKEAEVIPVPDEQDDNIVQVSVKLHSKLEVFPAKLRATLEKSYKDTIEAQMNTLESGTEREQKYTYSVVFGQCVRPSNSGFSTRIWRDHISDLSLANVELLKRLVERQSEFVSLKKATFHPLKTKEGLANPEFNNLHSVRHGELGWGLDTHGCLSLFTTSIEDSGLVEKVLYVQRREVKIEDLS